MDKIIIIYQQQLILNYLLVGSISAFVFLLLGVWIGVGIEFKKEASK